MARRIFLCFVLMCHLAFAQGAWEVTPGVGVGPVKLDQSPQQINSLLAPTEVMGTSRNPRFIRYGDNVLVEFNVGKAIMISLHSNSFTSKAGQASIKLNGGVGVGSPFTQVESVYGRNYISQELKTAKGHPREVYYAYKGLGLGFRIKAGRVAHIDVFSRGF